jgi:HNH endonuclease
METSVRRHVRQRARHRCEYCCFPEAYAALTPFHVEHIVAKQHGGGDHPSNLALACHHRNHHKGPNLTGIDPRTKMIAKLFHPRRHDWSHHFRWDGPVLVGRTAIGRATIAVLLMNDPDAQSDRDALVEEGLFP